MRGGRLMVMGVFFLGNYFINIFVLLLVYNLFFKTSYFLNYFIPTYLRFANCSLRLFRVVLIFYFSFISLLFAIINAFYYSFYVKLVYYIARITSASESFLILVRIMVYSIFSYLVKKYMSLGKYLMNSSLFFKFF